MPLPQKKRFTISETIDDWSEKYSNDKFDIERALDYAEQGLFSIQIPVASMAILTGLELSLAKTWRTVIAVEFVASTRYGLGYAIWDATEYLDFDTVIPGIIAIITIHFLLNRMIKLATKAFIYEPS